MWQRVADSSSKFGPISPLHAASLSLIPGLGHLVLGKRGKAIALFILDLGIVCSVFFLRSTVGCLLACFSYLIIMIPAVIETYALARGEAGQFSESKYYIVALLLMEGFSALPLLWQSRVFSKRIKIAWSIAVPVLAILYFSFLGVYGIRLYNYAKIRFG